MIVLNKDKILKDYFIDENSVITDQFGNIQEPYLRNGRFQFKGYKVHQIMMYTFFGIKSGDYVIHHADWNPKNNKLENLVYLTRAEHAKLHHKGRHLPAEVKYKIRIAKQNISAETRKKIRATKIGDKNSSYGKHWWTDGIKNIFCKPDEVPAGFVAGRIKIKK